MEAGSIYREGEWFWNTGARKLYKKLGYTEADIVSCVFNGIEGVQLVCLEKYIGK